jgi:hypothetical protein
MLRTILGGCSVRNATGAGEWQQRAGSAISLPGAVIETIVISKNVMIARGVGHESAIDPVRCALIAPAAGVGMSPRSVKTEELKNE